MHVWKTWSFAATNGILAMYGVGGDPPIRGVVEWGEVRTTVDYPPGTLAGLAAIGHVYRWMDPEYRDTRALTVLIKLSILLMDVLACALVYRLGARRRRRRIRCLRAPRAMARSSSCDLTFTGRYHQAPEVGLIHPISWYRIGP